MSIDKLILSIAVITYNHEQFIRQCLESILMQKVDFKFEVVIGEDCSTDRTRAVVCEFEARYPDIIKPIYHNTNVGGARNAYEFCFPRLTGKYVACLEGDDYWTDPFKLQKQVTFLEANPECSFCYHPINAVNEGDEIIERGVANEHVSIYKPTDVFHLKITTLSVVFRNCITLTPEEMIRLKVSDYVLFALLSNYGGAANLGFIGGHYRRHPGGMFTSLNTVERYKYSLNLLKRMFGYQIFSEEQKTEIKKEIALRKKRYIKELMLNFDLLNCVRIAFF